MSTLQKGQWGFTEQKIERVLNYEWTIKNYSFLDTPVRKHIQSPTFSISSEKTNWTLHLYPNGTYLDDYPDNVHLHLIASDASNEFVGICELSVLNGNRQQYTKSKQKIVVGTQYLEWNIFQKYTLLNKLNYLLPNDCLTVRCEFFKIGDLVNSSSKCEEQIQRQLELSSGTWGLKKLFLDERLSDVKIITSCGKSLPAHKCVLAAHSPVFEAMFVNDMREKSEDEVKIDDGKFEILKEILRFIYTGKLENLTANAAELIQLADKYQIMELRNICEEELNNAISIDNVIDILTIAQQHSIEHLKKCTIIFIKMHHEEIIRSVAFKSLSNVQILKTITEAISQ